MISPSHGGYEQIPILTHPLRVKSQNFPKHIFLSLPLRNSRYFCFQVAGYLRREGMSNGEGDESHNMLLQEIFHEEDKNKDGFISHEEFQGIKHHEL